MEASFPFASHQFVRGKVPFKFCSKSIFGGRKLYVDFFGYYWTVANRWGRGFLKKVYRGDLKKKLGGGARISSYKGFRLSKLPL